MHRRGATYGLLLFFASATRCRWSSAFITIRGLTSVQVVPNHEQSVPGINAVPATKGAQAAASPPAFSGRPTSSTSRPAGSPRPASASKRSMTSTRRRSSASSNLLRVLDLTCGSASAPGTPLSAGTGVRHRARRAAGACGDARGRQGARSAVAMFASTHLRSLQVLDVAVINLPYGPWWPANDPWPSTSSCRHEHREPGHGPASLHGRCGWITTRAVF